MNITTYKEYRKAFSEVNFILNNLESSARNKIPKQFKNLIEENMDNDYIISFDLKDGLENCNLLQKTKDILSLIYRDYICNEEEKEELKRIWKIEENTYNLNTTFVKVTDKKSNKEENIKINNSLVEIPKQKWYKILQNKILKILKK